MKITAEALKGNHRLRAIARAGVGVDNIDPQAATRQGIVVMNTPGGNTISTAEHTLALMLGLSRNLAAAHQSLVEHRWDRKKFMGTQLAGKTLGIIGLGPHRPRRGDAGPGPGNARPRLRPLPLRRAGEGNGHPVRRRRPRIAAPGRLPHRTHAAERRDAEPDRGRRKSPC